MSWPQPSTILLGLGASALGFALSIALVSAMVLRLPADYLAGCEPEPWIEAEHPLLRLLLRGGQIVGGGLLVLAGVILSLPGIPGPGLLTILVGLLIMGVPGRHRLVRAVLRRPRILASANRLRLRFARPPLALP